MTLENVLAAAAAAIGSGKRTPHCFAAHVPGKGYVNRGQTADEVPEFRRQAHRTILSAIENLTYAPKYAESGYEQPKRGVLLADWNVFPAHFDRVLERLGYGVEWSDEWSICDDCNGAIRTEPDGFCWQAGYSLISDSELLCVDCLQDAYPDSEYLD